MKFIASESHDWRTRLREYLNYDSSSWILTSTITPLNNKKCWSPSSFNFNKLDEQWDWDTIEFTWTRWLWFCIPRLSSITSITTSTKFSIIVAFCHTLD
jgi:hypothetical protein